VHQCWLVALFITMTASAQTYPNKPIRLVLPYPPGGGTDVIARPLAQKLTENLGQQVIVDNRGGANGNIGMEFVAKSPADGYTLLFALTAQYAINPSLYPKLSYDPLKDYAPISLLANAPYLLVVHPSVPAKSTAELTALMKARPGQLAYSSSGNGSGAHLAGEMLRSLARVQMTHVPYKGAGPAMPDLIAGQVQLSFVTYTAAGPHIKTGRLRALGVTTAKRSPTLPDLPAIAETVTGYDSAVWYGFAAPAGTLAEIVNKLNAEVLRVLAAPDFRSRITLEAVAPIGTSPDEFGSFMKSEIVRWAKVVRDSGAKVD
ncbi:MAG TPA: tripartite tricarboxylate transporter substrate binding protein, partial [Burkholderiales bacterium]|nr:tripartite tricarboxylate transporter substrate binding protein [Burkholderiales bacterium]